MSTLISPLLWLHMPFQDQTAWHDFLWHHEQWHRELEAAAFSLSGIKSVHFPLDDLTSNTTGHQQMHDSLASALQIPRTGDLTTVEFEDRDQFVSWHFVHALDHQRMRLVARI